MILFLETKTIKDKNLPSLQVEGDGARIVLVDSQIVQTCQFDKEKVSNSESTTQQPLNPYQIKVNLTCLCRNCPSVRADTR